MCRTGGLAHTGELPGRGIREVLVIARGFAVGRLVLLAEMAAAALVALQRVQAHQFGQFEEVGHAARLFERLVQLLARAQHLHVPPELLAQFGNLFQRLLQAARVRAMPQYSHMILPSSRW